MKISLREGHESDINFIVATWLRSLRDKPGFEYYVPKEIWYDKKATQIKIILAGAHTIVACDPADKTKIYAYLVCDAKKPLIHYVYVKKDYKECGIALELINSYRRLIDAERKTITISHITAPFLSRFMTTRYRENFFSYDPFVI